jgi:hypothetical protein
MFFVIIAVILVAVGIFLYKNGKSSGTVAKADVAKVDTTVKSDVTKVETDVKDITTKL